MNGNGLEIISVTSYDVTDAPDGGIGDLVDDARQAEADGIDALLVGYAASNPDGWIIAANILNGTSTIKTLLAHRPGPVAPNAAARMAATLAATSGGRLALNVVSGGSKSDQLRDGDPVEHDDRYRRAIEYVGLLKRLWRDEEPVDHVGEFYSLTNSFLNLKPRSGWEPAIFMGGASDAAKDFAASSVDTYMSWTEPLEQTRGRFEEITAMAAALGRPRPRYSVSARIILGETEEAAWATAHALVSDGASRPVRVYAEDAGRSRQAALAQESVVHDDRLWLGLTAATGGLGNTGALVGTADQVHEALMRYVREAGADTFVLTGADGFVTSMPEGFLEGLRAEADPIVAERTVARSFASA